MLDTQEIINGTCSTLIANSQVYSSFREVGRDTSAIELNLAVMYELYLAIPYFDADPDYDIQAAQLLIEQSQPPNVEINPSTGNINISELPNQIIQDQLTITQRNSIESIYTIQSGQTVSYAGGDDGYYKHGRLVDFFTLKTNNIFGNTLRFTDENGLQIFGSNYAIDHATGYGWCVTPQTTAVWAVAVAKYLTFSLTVDGVIFTDFFLPNISEMFAIAQWNDVCYKYAPFNINPGVSTQYWCSTTSYNATTTALRISVLAQFFPSSASKSVSQPYLMCRKHF